MKETTHRRDLLRVEQLEEFAVFCRAHGFQRRAPKGEHEVLRSFVSGAWAAPAICRNRQGRANGR